MNCAIYVRVSTQQQAEHGYSLQTQEESTMKLQTLKKQEQNLTERLTIKKENIPTEEIVKDVRQKVTKEEKRQYVLNHIEKVIVLRHDFVNRYDVDLDITIIFRS